MIESTEDREDTRQVHKWAITGPAAYENAYSMLFDGVDEYMTIANPSTFHFNDAGQDQPFSVSFWAKMTGANEYSQRFVTKGVLADREWAIFTNYAGSLYFQLYGNAGGSINIGVLGKSVMTAYLNTWVHIVCTYDGSEAQSGVKIYREGTEMEYWSASAGSYTGLNNSGEPVVTAHYPSAGYLTGNMDEISFWDIELDSSEVTELYNSGAPANLEDHSACANIISWFRMGEKVTSFPTIPDQKGGNNGTAVNMEAGDIEADTP